MFKKSLNLFSKDNNKITNNITDQMRKICIEAQKKDDIAKFRNQIAKKEYSQIYQITTNPEIIEKRLQKANFAAQNAFEVYQEMLQLCKGVDETKF